MKLLRVTKDKIINLDTVNTITLFDNEIIFWYPDGQYHNHIKVYDDDIYYETIRNYILNKCVETIKIGE